MSINVVGDVRVFTNRSEARSVERSAKTLGLKFKAGTHNFIKLFMVLATSYFIWISLSFYSYRAQMAILEQEVQVKCLQIIARLLPLAASVANRILAMPPVAAAAAGSIPYAKKRIGMIGSRLARGNIDGARNVIRNGMAPNVANLSKGAMAAYLAYTGAGAIRTLSNFAGPSMGGLSNTMKDKFLGKLTTIAANKRMAMGAIRTMNSTMRMPGQPLGTRAFSGMLINLMNDLLGKLVVIIRLLLGAGAHHMIERMMTKQINDVKTSNIIEYRPRTSRSPRTSRD